MSSDYATINDIQTLGRPLTNAEQTRAIALLPIASDRLRQAFKNYGRDLDDLIDKGKVYASVVKEVVVNMILRDLNTPNNETPLSQVTESGLGYSQTGTYLIPGGGLYPKNAELEALGLKRPRYGAIDMMGCPEGAES